MPARLRDLPKHIRDQIEAEHGSDAGMTRASRRGRGRKRAKPSRSETGKRTVGRCIPSNGSGCDWTGPYGTGFERHARETGHSRLELIDTSEDADT